jgi:hypothetical protein
MVINTQSGNSLQSADGGRTFGAGGGNAPNARGALQFRSWDSSAAFGIGGGCERSFRVGREAGKYTDGVDPYSKARFRWRLTIKFAFEIQESLYLDRLALRDSRPLKQ